MIDYHPLFKERLKGGTRPRVLEAIRIDLGDPIAFQIAVECQSLKAKRKWYTTVIMALRLFLDLQRGSTDVLFELFPWLITRLPAATPDNQVVAKLMAEIEALHRKITDSKATPLPPPTLPEQHHLAVMEAPGNDGDTTQAMAASMSAMLDF